MARRSATTSRPSSSSTKKATSPSTSPSNHGQHVLQAPNVSPRLSASKKRKAVDLDAEEPASPVIGLKKKQKKTDEKRARKFRKKAPLSFLEKLHRAQIQRMIVLSRTTTGTETHPGEDIDIVGSTGNIYRVTIGRIPSCNCQDSRKGHECKHKVYALHTVLKAPVHLQYQLAFLSSELEEIFANSPPIPTETQGASDKDRHRKSTDGECPICYMDLDEVQNELVWCKEACGNNMHKSCFEQWAASQRGTTIKCVYCRAPWKMDHSDRRKIMEAGHVSEDGYVNVADHFGISRARDYSSYHAPWVRRQFGMG